METGKILSMLHLEGKGKEKENKKQKERKSTANHWETLKGLS